MIPDPTAFAATSLNDAQLTAADGLPGNERTGPARVCAWLGPGAAPIGIGQVLNAWIATQTAFSATASGLTAAVLAKAILTYNGAGSWTQQQWLQQWRVGRRLILPVESAAGGGWTTSSTQLLAWAGSGSFTDQQILTSAQELIASSPTPDVLLALPSASRQAATALLPAAGAAPDPALLATVVLAPILLNPFDAVFTFIELMRILHRDFPATEQPFAQALVAPAAVSAQQLSLLATTTAGNAIARRIWTALPATADNSDSRDIVAAALGLRGASSAWSDPTALAATVTPAELPMTAAQRNTAATNPKSVHYGIAFGRRISLGTPTAAIGKGKAPVNWRGYGEGGSLKPALVLANLDADSEVTKRGGVFGARRAALQPAIDVAVAIALNEGALDACNCWDSGLVSSGFQQWTVQHDDELAVNLYRFRMVAPDYYDALIGLYGLNVDGAPGNAAGVATYASAPVPMIGAVADPGFPATVVMSKVSPTQIDAIAAGTTDRYTFFGVSTTVAGITTQHTSDGRWAAYFRLAAWYSIDYRIVQLQAAVFRFHRILNAVTPPPPKGSPPRPTVKITSMPVGTTGKTWSVTQLLTSQLGVAWLLDQHINAPNAVVRDLVAALTKHIGVYSAAALDPYLRLLFSVDYVRARQLNDKPKRDQAILTTLSLDDAADTFGSASGDSSTGWLTTP